jgi:hypothetical protein
MKNLKLKEVSNAATDWRKQANLLGVSAKEQEDIVD